MQRSTSGRPPVRRLLAILVALALALPPLPALGQGTVAAPVPGGVGMANDARNATLPTARGNLGFVNYVSVMDPTYGAKCDGATDDSVAIQAAANAVPAGGVLLLPAGKVCNYTTTLTITAGIHIKGEGPQSSGELFWVGDATSDHIVVASGVGPFQAADVRMISAAGTTYSVNDTITLNDGCGTHAIVKVARLSGTGVADARITTVGSCTVQPSPTTAITQLSTSGSGTGATFKVFYGSHTTKINNPEFTNVILGSTTTMASGCALRTDYTYALYFRNSRIYGNSNIWRGICMSRAITTHIGDGSLIDNVLGESIVISGTDYTGNQSSDLILNQVQLQGCNLAIASKAAALLTGCILTGDNAAGMFFNHMETLGGFLGYAVYLGAVNGAAATHGLFYFNDMNVEAGGTWSGFLSGLNFNNVFIGGNTWAGAVNIDAIHFPAGAAQLQISPSVLIYSNVTDASSPNGIYINGSNVDLNGTVIGDYAGGGVLGAGIYLDSSSNIVNLNSTAIRQWAAGIQGNSAVGTYTIGEVTMQNNTVDLSGITCAAFARPLINALTSTNTPLCPNWATTGTLAVGGAVSLGSTTNFLGGATGITLTGAAGAYGITYATINQMFSDNLYYNGSWKYAANGTGLAFIMTANSTNALDIYTAPNNAGGAGAAASPTTPVHVVAASNEWDFPGIVTAAGTITGTNLIPSGSAAPTVGMGLPAAGKLGLYGTTSVLFSGATDIWDYGVTTASVFTIPVATSLPGIASSAAALDAMCWNATGGVLTHNAAGALCSASLEELKDISGTIEPSAALAEVMALKPIWAKFKDDVKTTSDHAVHPMFGAHQVEGVDPRLAAYDGDGKLLSVEYLYISALNTAALQELKHENDDLKAELADLRTALGLPAHHH